MSDALFDFCDCRGPARDLDSIAEHSAKDRAGERRDIGYGAVGGFGLVFTDDAKCLRPAIVALHCDRRPELYFAVIGCWLYDFRA